MMTDDTDTSDERMRLAREELQLKTYRAYIRSIPVLYFADLQGYDPKEVSQILAEWEQIKSNLPKPGPEVEEPKEARA